MAVKNARGIARVAGIDINHQNVNSPTAVKVVVAILTFQPVGIATAPKGIVAAAAEELILPGSAAEGVGATGSGWIGIGNIKRSG